MSSDTGNLPPSVTASRMRKAASPRRALFVATALIATGADQAGKAWADDRYGARPRHTASFWPLRFELVHNAGASFGLGAGLTPLITLVTLSAVVALAYAGWRSRGRAWAVALGLITGGAAGNGLDRILRAPGPFRGAVVDWIKLPFYGPVFNLADVALRTGVLIALILLLRGSVVRRAEAAG